MMETIATATIQAIQAAARSKAPVTAIPVEGHAPFCVRTRLLQGALKGVTITRVTVEKYPDKVEVVDLRKEYDPVSGQWLQPEGPAAREVTPGEWRLVVIGTGGKSWVRTRAAFVRVGRREALREIRHWSEKERERGRKRAALGAAGAKFARAVKQWEHELAGEGTVAQRVWTKNSEGLDVIATVRGVPIEIPGWEEFAFLLHGEGGAETGEVYEWKVTERSTGLLVAWSCKSARAAIESAALKMAERGRADLMARIAGNQLPASTAGELAGE